MISDDNPYRIPDHPSDESTESLGFPLAEPISVSGRLLRSDLKRLHRQLPLAAFLVVGAVIYLVVQFLSAGSLSGLPGQISTGGIFLFAATWLTVSAEFKARRSQKKAEADGVAPFDLNEYVISPEGLTMRSEHAEGRTRWTGFSGVSKTDDLVILHRPGNVVTPLLKRWFSDRDTWNTVVGFLESQVQTTTTDKRS